MENHRGLLFFFSLYGEKGLTSKTVIFVLLRKCITVSRVVALVPDIPASRRLLTLEFHSRLCIDVGYHQPAASGKERIVRSLARSHVRALRLRSRRIHYDQDSLAARTVRILYNRLIMAPQGSLLRRLSSL